MSLPDLAAVLWRQREVMELLAYELECEQLLMASGRTERLVLSVSNVETVAGRLQVLELQRAEAADRAAAELGVPAGAGLSEIAVAAGPPWSELLLEHRTELISLSQEVRSLGDSTRKLAGGAAKVVENALRHAGLAGDPSSGVGYDASGRSDFAAPRVRVAVDRVM